LAKSKPDPSDDAWLTLAEIAEELRVNPATVRNWVARGRLDARRAGQRKLLVQRSELNRMLAGAPRPGGTEAADGAAAHPRVPAPRRPVRCRQWSLSYLARTNVPAEVTQRAAKSLQEAGAVWDAALDASEDAPPDPGFVGRLRAIRAAAERQREALGRARLIPGFYWEPVLVSEDMILSHELRPGANRPGPEHLWNSFDRTVERLGLAMEGTSVSSVHIEYVDLGRVLGEVIDALEATGDVREPARLDLEAPADGV
jgi:excisionase family DNA binding protein